MTNTSIRIAALAGGVALVVGLAGCSSGKGGTSSGSGLGVTKPAGATTPAGGGAGNVHAPNGACTDAIHTAVVALVTVSVGSAVSTAGANGGTSTSCIFGIGKNAGVSDANQLMQAEDDTVLVTVVGGAGVSMYSQNLFPGDPTPVSGVGDRAEYYYSTIVGSPPDFYALKGQTYCEVQVNAADAPTELGVPGQNAGNISADGAKTVAAKEGAVCTAAFGQ